MTGSLEGIEVKITLTVEGWFETAPPYGYSSVVVAQRTVVVGQETERKHLACALL